MSWHTFVMLMVLSMSPFHSLCHNDQTEVIYDFFSHVRPVVPALLSCDAKFMWCCWDQCEYHMTLMAVSITPFCLLGNDYWNKMQNDFGSCDTSVGITWHWWYHEKHNCICYFKIINMRCIMTFFSYLTLLALALASCDANGIFNSTTVFIRSRQLSNVQHNFSGHAMALMLVSMSHDANSAINGTIPFVR